MPIHDWTRVEAGIFHNFQLSWICAIADSLNRGLLPAGYYALIETSNRPVEPDCIVDQAENDDLVYQGNAFLLSETEPKVRFRIQGRADQYSASSLVIRHQNGHRTIAGINIVSPGNKNSRHGLHSFLRKVHELLRAGTHLLILDLHPPGPRDPQGIHKVIWDELFDDEFALPSDMPLTLVSYRADQPPEAFIEPTAVGLSLHPMPVFLNVDEYISLPLEISYQRAWRSVPEYLRDVIEGTQKA